jgi:hypothetical protein
LRTAACGTLLVVGWAADAEAQTAVSHLKIKGEAVNATFISLDSTDPCFETAVTVIASNAMQKTSPGQKTRTTATELVISRVDVCAGISIFEGQGSAEVHDLRIAGNLRSATLTASVIVEDTAGDPVLFTVALSWTATGPAVRNHEHEIFRDEDLGLFINSHVRGKIAPAVATGAVIGLGENWTPEPSTSAEIMTQSSGTVTIERTR